MKCVYAITCTIMLELYIMQVNAWRSQGVCILVTVILFSGNMAGAHAMLKKAIATVYVQCRIF